MRQRFDAPSVVEVQYTGWKPVAPDYWRFDEYARIGRYGAERVATRITRVADIQPPDTTDLSESDAQEVLLGSLNGALADAVGAGLNSGRPVLVVGGSCHVATGVVGGMQDALGAGARIGIVWFDAHGDFNTPATSLSQMKGGMPLACCAGLCWPTWREGSHMAAPVPTNRIIHWDGRDLDAQEEALMAMVGVQRPRVLSGGGDDSMETILARLARTVDVIYLHIDGDILDPVLMPGHVTPAEGGQDMDSVRSAMERVYSTGKVGALTVCSVFPSDDEDDTAVAVRSGCELVRTGLDAWSRHGWSGV